MHNNQKYIALTGDIKGSSQVEDREELRRHLLNLCAKINKYFSKNIVVNFKIVSGDGIQGLLSLDTNIVLLAHYIRAKIHPYFLRIGFGVGRVSTELLPDTEGMDGECFNYASSAINNAKATNHWFHLESKNGVINNVFNSIALYLQYYLDHLNRTEAKIVISYVIENIEYNYVTQNRIQDMTGILQPHISRALKKSKLEEMYSSIITYPTIQTLENIPY